MMCFRAVPVGCCTCVGDSSSCATHVREHADQWVLLDCGAFRASGESAVDQRLDDTADELISGKSS